MRAITRTALAACLLACLAAPLAAQGARRAGPWLAAGLGHGSAQLTCSICTGGRDGGTSGFLRAGATLSRQFLLGVEVLGWYRSTGPADYLLTSMQAVALVYPVPSRGFYLKAGLGLAQYKATDDQDEVFSRALAAQVGAGYEVPVSRGISVAPFVNFLGTSGADVRFNDIVSDLSANSSLIQVGLGVTLH